MVDLLDTPCFGYHRSMLDTPRIASIAALIGDPSRSSMLTALMDGRALTATELALEGDITASTASSHLAKLAAAGLVAMTKQGRHRYFRIAGPEVASVLEGLMDLTVRAGGPAGRPAVRTGPRDDDMRRARVCYDHLAGEFAVQLLARLRQRAIIEGPDELPELGGRGEKWVRGFGIDLDALRSRRRPLCLACLDWSERRTHLAGAVGAALLDRMFALRLVRRAAGSRALIFSQRGESFLKRLETP